MKIRMTIAAGCLLFAAVAGRSEASVAPPQNQCPGDCSPCLGPSDPFCGAPDPIDDTGKCQTCEATLDTGGHITGMSCVAVNPGELGHSSCKVTLTASKISCKTTGTTCGVAVRR